MIQFQRLSTGPTLPDLIRADADVRAAASGRLLPIEVWCRQSTLLVLRGQGEAVSRLPSGPLLPARVRRVGRTVTIRLCFLIASGMLTITQLLIKAGMLKPNESARPLRWSLGLVRTGMQLWRDSRLYSRP